MVSSVDVWHAVDELNSAEPQNADVVVKVFGAMARGQDIVRRLVAGDAEERAVSAVLVGGGDATAYARSVLVESPETRLS